MIRARWAEQNEKAPSLHTPILRSPTCSTTRRILDPLNSIKGKLYQLFQLLHILFCLLITFGVCFFQELNFHGHLKLLPGQNNRSEDGILMSPQLTLFAIATPRQPLTILELQNKTFLFQTKHKLDFTPIACDSRYNPLTRNRDSQGTKSAWTLVTSYQLAQILNLEPKARQEQLANPVQTGPVMLV